MLEKTLKSPLDSKEIKPVNPKENQPWYLLEGLIRKLQYFGHLMQKADSLEKTLMLGKTEGRRRRWHHWLNGHEFEQSPGDSEVQRSLVCCRPWGCKQLDTTERLNDKNITMNFIIWHQSNQTDSFILHSPSHLAIPVKTPNDFQIFLKTFLKSMLPPGSSIMLWMWRKAFYWGRAERSQT